jgi:predicted small lipoprotein YifL
MMRVMMTTVLAVVLLLAGCGKKGPLEPPPRAPAAAE